VLQNPHLNRHYGLLEIRERKKETVIKEGKKGKVRQQEVVHFWPSFERNYSLVGGDEE